MPILEGDKVTKYFGGLAAVSKVDFKIEKGELVGLIGPNGAGKTTLFNLISGALPLKSGTIQFKDRRINGLKPHQICRIGIARTFQSVKIFGNLPVVTNISLGSMFGQSKPYSITEASHEAAELLEFMGLSTVGSTAARELTLVSQKRLDWRKR